MKKLIMILTTIVPAAVIGQTTYTLDKNHTRIGFSTTHLKISEVDGRFKSFEAVVKSSKEDFTDAIIEVTVDVKSIDTDIEMRDNDLKSENWFNVEKYPKIIFKSTSFKKLDGKNYNLSGDITIRGITKPIILNVVYNGKQENPLSKKTSVGFTVTGKLNRSDFELGKNSPADVTVADEIKILCNAEFVVAENVVKK